MKYDVIIIGGGPAGLMAANQLEKARINYLLLEKNETYGKKLLLTGGRRCNVTNNLSVRDFIDTLTIKNKKFLYPALKTFGPKEIKSYFEEQGLELVLEDDFKYFPKTEKSISVLEVLTKSLTNKRIKFNQSVKEVHKENGLYEIITRNDTYYGKYVIVATGSNSYPSTGSSGDGLNFAKSFGIQYTDFTPAETYVYSEQVVREFGQLQGTAISKCRVNIKNLKKSFEEDLLFTHFGLSGPVIMHLSEFIYKDILLHKQSVIEFGFIRQTEQELYNNFLNNKEKNLHKVLEMYTNKRIVDVMLKHINIESKKIVEIKKKDLFEVCKTFTNLQFKIDTVEDKEKAFVNKGGIDLKELDPQSMESRHIKGLYFIGETTDLHGPIGGYNITIALSTGNLSSQDIICKLKDPFHK